MDTGLPISRAPKFSVAFWVNGTGTGQNDRRMFSEGSTLTTDPLFNLGTHNAGTDNTVDVFIRNSGVKINHLHSVKPGINGEWHHVAWTETNGVAALYIDGVVDSTFTYAPGPTAMDTISVGAILRATPGAFFAGAIDEVAVWERGLTAVEIQEIMNNGIQTPVPAFSPVIALQPASNTNLVEGKSVTLTARATGTRPLAYQWQRNGTAIPNATGTSLILSNLKVADSGNYTFQVQNASTSVVSEVAQILVKPPEGPNLTNSLVAYWPLNEIIGTKTPDVMSGYDMNVVNLTPADIVPGKFGNAFKFDRSRSTILERVHASNEDLPINKHLELTIALWTQVDYTGQNDLRVFSEGNTGNTDPLFNIGTHSTGGGPEVDLYIRQTGWTLVDHPKSVQPAFDGTWHHIAFVQDLGGTRTLYIDGIQDDLAIAPRDAGTYNVNDTTIGGILRASRTHFISGLIDEVALWKRALSPAEITKLMAEGIPAVASVPLPLVIHKFQADYPTVVQGGTVTLRWDVTKDVAVSIDQGVGNVSSRTVSGAGSVAMAVSQDTTYTLTLTRGAESMTRQVPVKVLPNVATGWNLLDNFDVYSTGRVTNKGQWVNPEGVINIEARGSGNVLAIDDGTDLAALALNSLSITQGQKGTLFFRMYAVTNDTAAVTVLVGLTEKAIRASADFNGDNVGPYVRFERLDTEENLMLSVYNSMFEPASITLERGKFITFGSMCRMSRWNLTIFTAFTSPRKDSRNARSYSKTT